MEKTLFIVIIRLLLGMYYTFKLKTMETKNERINKAMDVYKLTGLYNKNGLFDNVKIVNKQDDQNSNTTILENIKQIDKPKYIMNTFNQKI